MAYLRFCAIGFSLALFAAGPAAAETSVSDLAAVGFNRAVAYAAAARKFCFVEVPESHRLGRAAALSRAITTDPAIDLGAQMNLAAKHLMGDQSACKAAVEFVAAQIELAEELMPDLEKRFAEASAVRQAERERKRVEDEQYRAEEDRLRAANEKAKQALDAERRKAARKREEEQKALVQKARCAAITRAIASMLENPKAMKYLNDWSASLSACAPISVQAADLREKVDALR